MLFPFSEYSCQFVRGDGIGGTEQNIGNKPNPQACIDACINKKKTEPDINGVTMRPSGKGSCYCEKKWKRSNNSPSWKTCHLRLKDSESGVFLERSYQINLIMKSVV